MFRRKTQAQCHVHKWITVSSSANYSILNPNGTKLSATLLLQRCSCGENRTAQLEGKWTREELGIDDKTVADLHALLNDLTQDTEEAEDA